MDFFWSAPVVARTITALAFAESILVHGKLLSYRHVLFFPSLLFKFWPEIWRLFTPFFLVGGGISFVFDLYFLYTYSSKLETGSPRFTGPGDFFTYVVFVASVIMLTAGFILNSVTFTSALILAFIFTYSQDNRGTKTTFYIIQIPTELLPWAMLTLTLVTAGWPAALSEGMGIVAAHLYDFLTRIYPTFGGGRNYITTPNFVKRYFTTYLREGEYRTYGRAFRPASTQAQDTPSTGWASSFQNTWGSRGAGRRLGGS